MSPVFLEACKRLTVRYPDLGFIVPLVNDKRREQFMAIKAELAPDLDMVLLEGQGVLHEAAPDRGSERVLQLLDKGTNLRHARRALGLVRIAHADGTLAFAAPPLKRSAPSPALVPLIASALGLRPQQILGAQLLDNGPVWLGLLLDSADTVLGLHPDHARLKDLGQDVGVIHVSPTASNTSQPGAVVRAFAAPMGNPEDPVTGTLNASLAEWLIADGLAPRSYLVAQGECLGRAGRVHIRQDDDHQLWVGGRAVTCIEGTVLL